jgi:GLPGLI family protein
MKIQNILIIINLIVANLIVGQTTKITYKLNLLKPETNKTIQQEEEFNKINLALSNITYELYLTKQIALFQMNEIMNDHEFIERAKIETGIEPYFIKENTKYTLNDEVFFPKNSYLIKEEMPKWTLLDETKTINGMVCYKAISNYSTRPNNSFPIVAWYCPSLSSNFGPYGIGGLPGTILILQYGYKVFTANSIKHNVSKLIEFPNNIEIITMEKYIEKLNKLEEEMFQE